MHLSKALTTWLAHSTWVEEVICLSEVQREKPLKV